MGWIERHVDQLFKEIPAEYGSSQCQNPVTGGWFIRGLDPIAPQKRLACRALEAREWSARTGPPDLPPLPVSGEEIDEIKRGQGLLHLFAYFARSIASRDYVVEGHPPFDVYASGMLASPYSADFFKKNEELKRRFPPRLISGLGPDNCSSPPEEHARTMKLHQRSLARKAAARGV
jgi:hypothetical protein